jgi:hypothetical protein
VLLNHVPDIPVQIPRFHNLNRLIQTLSRDPHKFLTSFVNVTNQVRFVQITVVSVHVDRDINIQNVTVLKLVAVGDAVTNDFVDGCAAGFGKVVVV